jgi:hypothetical protein
MDSEFRDGNIRFTTDWSLDKRTVALIATTNAKAEIIDRTLRRAAPQGALVRPAEVASREDAPGSPRRIIGRIVFDAPQSDEDRLTLTNTIHTILNVELSGGL